MPWYASTVARRWTSLGVIGAVMCVASGPIASWPTLEPLIISDGAFASRGREVQQELLSECYSVALFVQMATYFVAGLFFDLAGPMAIGVGGALVASVGLGLFAVALMVPGADALIFVGYPMAAAGGSACSIAMCTQMAVSCVCMYGRHCPLVDSV